MSEVIQSKLSKILSDLESIGHHEDGVVEMRKAGTAKYRLAGTRSGFMRLGTAILRAAHAPIEESPVGTVHDVFAPGSTAIETIERHDTLPAGVSFKKTVRTTSVKQFVTAFVLTAVIGTFTSIGANVTVEKMIDNHFAPQFAAAGGPIDTSMDQVDDESTDLTSAHPTVDSDSIAAMQGNN